MFGFLKSETFNIVFSFLIGLALITVCKSSCKGGECRIQKAPPADEVKTSTYQIGPKCFQFKSDIVECPGAGVIEPFERFVR